MLAAEADLQQLSYALKILLETEKHLRTSNNQATWLTAALLQLSSTVASYDASEVRLSVRTLDPQGETWSQRALFNLLFKGYVADFNALIFHHTTLAKFASQTVIFSAHHPRVRA